MDIPIFDYHMWIDLIQNRSNILPNHKKCMPIKDVIFQSIFDQDAKNHNFCLIFRPGFHPYPPWWGKRPSGPVGPIHPSGPVGLGSSTGFGCWLHPSATYLKRLLHQSSGWSSAQRMVKDTTDGQGHNG